MYVFDKFYVIIACCEDMSGRYCIQNCTNDHFHLKFAIIVFKIKSPSISVV